MIGTAVEIAAHRAGHEVVGTCATRPREGLRPFDMATQNLLDVVPDLGPDDRVLLLAAACDQAWVEAHPWESHMLNVLGAVTCAQAALGARAHLVFASSEAVFGGAPPDPAGFDEAAAPQPAGPYALQKFKVEYRLRPEACVARCGHVVGGAGHGRCAVSSTYWALLRPDAKMAPDNVFTITAVEDVAAGLLRLAEARTRGIVHLAANPPVTRTQLADWIIERSTRGLRMAYRSVPVSSLPMVRAPRAWLRCGRALEMGLSFADPRSVAERKVAMLDGE